MTKTFKHYVWIPPGVPNAAAYRAEADNDELKYRGLTIEDVTYKDLGEVLDREYVTEFTVKPFLWLRRWFRGV